jgi:uncharacterized protein
MHVEPLADIARKHGIALVIQFGSTVTGRAHDRSDMDLAVLFETTDPSLDDEIRLAADLQEHCPGHEVDLVVLNRADPLLLRRVAEEGELRWGMQQRFHEWKMYAYRRYQDHRPYLELERAFVKRALAELP